ncbi:MAG TPA: penicillin-binding transpeptidase domain-containing protein [Candidatus Polarisedimenticolia bacterium]
MSPIRRRLDRRPAGHAGRPEFRSAAWVVRVAILAAALYVSLWAWTGHRVGSAEAAWRAGRLEEAHVILSDAAFWHVRRGRVQDALGVVDLARGRIDEAAAHLAAARRGFFHPAAFGEERVLRGFLHEGRLEPARVYADHRARIREDLSTLFYLGVAENGLNRLDDAERHLAAAAGAAGTDLAQRAGAQRRLIGEKRRTGRSDYLLDRNGLPLVGIDLASGRSWLADPSLSGLLDGPWGPRLEAADQAGRVRLALDLEIQRAAAAALGARTGALVVLDVRDGGLLAAASRPASLPAPGGPAPLALARTYEPGSILKVLTLSAALRGGVDVGGIFPFACPGWIAIDGLPFRDWMPHRKVASIDEAIAVSCNLVFGRLGQLVGRDRLNSELRRYGFDYRSEPPAPVRSDFRFEVGALLAEDGAHPNFALARRAEGLDSIEITPIGAALLAAGVARGGAPLAPHLIEEKIDILGESSYRREAPAAPDGPLSAAATALIARVMMAAVTQTEGTARRAAVDGLIAAMKTGTSGTNPPGYDALMIGFAPAEDPRIAWALVAEHAGKAEFEAARITKDFLGRIRDRVLRYDRAARGPS